MTCQDEIGIYEYMFYYRIKDIIKGSGQTYREIAKKSGVDLSTLVRLSKAQSQKDFNLTLQTLDKLCRYFKKKPWDFIKYK